MKIGISDFGGPHNKMFFVSDNRAVRAWAKELHALKFSIAFSLVAENLAMEAEKSVLGKIRSANFAYNANNQRILKNIPLHLTPIPVSLPLIYL